MFVFTLVSKKLIAKVFDSFKSNLFWCIQCETEWISVFNSSEVGLLLKRRLVSSAKKYGVENLQASTKSLKYSINNTGPRTEPWGTPFFTISSFDILFFHITHCVLDLRYEENQLKTWPLIPKFFNSSEWFTVSNASFKSRKTVVLLFPFSFSNLMFSTTFTSASTVDLRLRKPNWFSPRILNFSVVENFDFHNFFKYFSKRRQNRNWSIVIGISFWSRFEMRLDSCSF